MAVGYSGTPLAKKLGIKEGFTILGVDLPANYSELVEPLPADVEIVAEARPGLDLIHFFTNSRDDLLRGLSEYKDLIKQNGTIWVSWYKRAAKLPTEITEDDVRNTALDLGLVDVKVCAVDEKWSGLKLVIRVENRRSTRSKVQSSRSKVEDQRSERCAFIARESRNRCHPSCVRRGVLPALPAN